MSYWEGWEGSKIASNKASTVYVYVQASCAITAVITKVPKNW